MKMNKHLVGGFNPSEKYIRQIGSFPQQIGMKIKTIYIWNHQPEHQLKKFIFVVLGKSQPMNGLDLSEFFTVLGGGGTQKLFLWFAVHWKLLHQPIQS